MRIGIIGAGFVGRAVAQLGVAAGHQVMLSNSRGPQSLSSVPSGIGCAIGTVEEAARFGDVVVVAIPLGHYRSVPVQPLAGKLVIDANNYYPERDGQIAELDAHGTTTSALLAKHLAQARVVKAFSAITAVDLEKDGRPTGVGDRRALPIAGDDAAAKATVAELLEQFGFDVVDTGSLADSWRFERGKPAYCFHLDRKGLVSALAAAERNVELPDGAWPS